VLDGFIFIAVAGIVCVDIIPIALINGGLVSIVFLLLGLVFPVFIEKAFVHSAHKAHVFVVMLAAVGLTIHAVIDGVALLPQLGNETDSQVFLFGSQLAIGVILHRLPVGMAIWWSVRPTFGTPVALLTFALIIAATATAYWFGAPIIEIAETRSLAYFQAFVAGSLVHVVAFGISHDHSAEPLPEGKEWGYRVGILIGMFLIFAVPHIHS
jgi:zinc transporter ZupT